MTDDEMIAWYGTMKKLAEGMSAREAALDRKTAALDTAIAQLEKMPFALGKQTSQYIGIGVREAMEQDFSPPIKELFQGPTANLERATREARSVMAEVGKEARFHAFSWWGSIFALGILIGALGYHFLELRKFDDIQDQLTAIRQQITQVPVPSISTTGPTHKKSR